MLEGGPSRTSDETGPNRYTDVRGPDKEVVKAMLDQGLLIVSPSNQLTQHDLTVCGRCRRRQYIRSEAHHAILTCEGVTKWRLRNKSSVITGWQAVRPIY